MAKFKMSLGIGFANAKQKEVIEIPDEELEGLSEEDREKLLDEYLNDWMWNHIDAAIFEVE